MRFKVFGFLFIFIILLFFNLAFGAGEKIPWWSINAGGCIYSSSGDKQLCGSIGQPVAGKSENDTVAYSGFWTPWVVDVTEVEEEEEEEKELLPEDFSICQNYPNPFNPHTVIEYALPEQSHVSIVVYNILGQKVRVLRDEMERAGFKKVVWDGKDDKGFDVASGVYFYRIQATDFVKCKKMLLLK